jgi:hypothetical protein
MGSLVFLNFNLKKNTCDKNEPINSGEYADTSGEDKAAYSFQTPTSFVVN